MNVVADTMHIPVVTMHVRLTLILTYVSFLVKLVQQPGFEMCFGPNTLVARTKARLESRIQEVYATLSGL